MNAAQRQQLFNEERERARNGGGCDPIGYIAEQLVFTSEEKAVSSAGRAQGEADRAIIEAAKPAESKSFWESLSPF